MRDILCGRLKEGDVLPSQERLFGEFGTTPTDVSGALRHLEPIGAPGMFAARPDRMTEVLAYLDVEIDWQTVEVDDGAQYVCCAVPDAVAPPQQLWFGCVVWCCSEGALVPIGCSTCPFSSNPGKGCRTTMPYDIGTIFPY